MSPNHPLILYKVELREQPLSMARNSVIWEGLRTSEFVYSRCPPVALAFSQMGDGRVNFGARRLAVPLGEGRSVREITPWMGYRLNHVCRLLKRV